MSAHFHTPDINRSPPPPDAHWIEAQRQTALTHLAATRTALRCGQLGVAQTKLDLVETHIRAMAPPPATEDVR